MDGYREFLGRIGTFFLITGAFLFILFVSSDLAKKADFDFLFLSMLALGIGWIFRRKKPATPPAGRFAWYRTTRESRGKRGKEKAKEKK